MNELNDLPPHHTSEAILANPHFPAARSAYLRAMLELYENDAFSNRLITEAGRSVIFFNLLCLHATYDPNDRATWPTPGLLKRTAALFGVSSVRRFHDLIARLVETGYVEPRPAPTDRRSRLLIPTERMLAHDRAWLAAFYAPLHVMFPDPGYEPHLRRDPAYQKGHRTIARSFLSTGVQVMVQNPPMLFFMGREAGVMILIKLLCMTEDTPEEGRRPISFADLGQRFGTSRTHVRTMLQDAEELGYLKLPGNAFAPSPHLLAAFDRFVAETMSAHDLFFRLTTRVLAGTNLSPILGGT